MNISDAMHTGLLIGLILNAGGVILLLKIYFSMEQSLTILQKQLFEVHIRLLGRDYGTGIPGVAKDTEVAE